MNITYKTTKDDVNWEQVADILQQAGLSEFTGEQQRVVFQNSYAVIFVYDGNDIIGVGRAISDGVCQGAIYNIALREEYHQRGIGGQIIERLLAQLKGQTVILYTHPRTVGLYEKYGFVRNKTAMTLFSYPEDKFQFMKEEGFVLPDGFRFEEEQKYKNGGQ